MFLHLTTDWYAPSVNGGVTFVLNLIACGIRILFVLFALPVYGIRGYLCGLLISQAVMALLSIGILLRQTHFNA